MKNIFTIYNIMFLLLGNMAFSSFHQLHEHDHSNQTDICEECISLENNNHYVIDSKEVNFSNKIVNQFVPQFYNNVQFNIEQIYHTRAPPIF